ncbi:MAG: hypothetical protein ACRDMV_18270 [Streptosporangiales bacterium]
MTARPRQRPTSGKTLSPNVEGLQVGDTPRRGKSQKTKQRESQTPMQADDKPKYQRMLRMEGRLREDQMDSLAKIRRRVSSDRDDKSERITDNTLVRIAVDLLISHADELSGDTEDDLRSSVTR